MTLLRSISEIQELELFHRQFVIDDLENTDTDYLLHQNDYVTVFDFIKNRPKAVYATVDSAKIFEKTRRFSSVRMDPRTHSWSNAKVPLFPTDLSSRWNLLLILFSLLKYQSLATRWRSRVGFLQIWLILTKNYTIDLLKLFYSILSDRFGKIEIFAFDGSELSTGTTWISLSNFPKIFYWNYTENLNSYLFWKIRITVVSWSDCQNLLLLQIFF